MSLLPARFQNQDDMPMSLGKAIARAIAPKVDPNAWFETYNHDNVPHGNAPRPPLGPTPEWLRATGVTIKGSAKASTAAEKVGASRPLPEAAPPSVQKTFKVKGAARAPKPHAYRCETCCDTFRVMTMVCYGGRPFEKEDDCPDCSTLKAQFVDDPEPAATPVALGDGWIEWRGGKCPVPAGTLIDTRHRIGYCGNKECFLVLALEDGGPSHAALWSSDHHPADIIAYRLWGAA